MVQRLVALALIAVALGLIPVPSIAQTVDLNSAVALRQNIRPVPDIVYLRTSGWEGRLDVYAQLEWPLKRITVNLAPAGLRKEGSGFDLSIALAVLAGPTLARAQDECAFKEAWRLSA